MAATVGFVLRRRWPIIVLVVWTAYVWTTRIVNAWSAVDETQTAKLISTASAVVLLALAIAVAIVLVAARARSFTRTEARLLIALGVATIAIWAVRIPQIVLDGRGVAFIIVHVVLGAISIGLAAVTIRKARSESGADSDGSALGAASPAASGAR